VNGHPPGETGALSRSVLVLNRFYLAIHVVNVRRAFVLLYRDLAEILDVRDGQFANYSFARWLEVSQMRSVQQAPEDDWIRTVRCTIQVPRVVRLLDYDKIPRHSLRFNRRNLFARDGHCCQYCGQHLPASQLSIDHVIPRSRGGLTSWDNVVCCCLRCNSRKGGRTPHEARMKLIRTPAKPRHHPLLVDKLNNPRYAPWRAFFPEAVTPNEN
jgi:5-methylcytosine-specific restriction endonuclease McrA